MPYESFPSVHQLTIRGLVQDTSTGAWRFLIHVKRTLPRDIQSRPHVYAIRRSYADFKRLHAAISPTIAVLPKLPVDSLFSFFVGETQTVLQRKRVVLEAILKAIESHPQANTTPAFLEFLANTENYEQFSAAPASPSGSFKDFSASYELHKASHHNHIFGTNNPASASVSHAPAPLEDRLRRRNSTLLPMRTTSDPPRSGNQLDARQRSNTIEADSENRVEFMRYSQL